MDEDTRIRVVRDGRLRILKVDTSWDAYHEKYPEAYQVKKPPTQATLQKYLNSGITKAVDGCKVEPDGTCPHGKPSWLMALGLV